MQAQLKELFESVNELAKTPIWRDESDGRVAINRKKTYARFKSLGVSPRDALNALAGGLAHTRFGGKEYTYCAHSARY